MPHISTGRVQGPLSDCNRTGRSFREPPPLPEGLPQACQVAPFCRPPDTESLRKRSKWHFPLPTCYGFPRKRAKCLFLPPIWHGIPAKVFQVASSCRPPATESPQKCSRWHLPASHLTRFSRESVPSVSSCLPPDTESLRKCSRWETSFGGFVHYVMSRLFSRTNE